MGTAAALPSRVTPTPGDPWQSPPPTLDGPTLPVVQRHWGSSHVSGNLQNHGSAPDLTDRALDGSSPKTAPAAGVPGPPRRGRHGSAFRSLVKNRTANGTQMTPVDQNPHRTTRLAWTPDTAVGRPAPAGRSGVRVCMWGLPGGFQPQQPRYSRVAGGPVRQSPRGCGPGCSRPRVTWPAG